MRQTTVPFEPWITNTTPACPRSQTDLITERTSFGHYHINRPLPKEVYAQNIITQTDRFF